MSATLEELEAKVNALLPEQYHLLSEPVCPTSMGSASLKYGPDSRVAWDQIWTSFCDLALAGGPPHRGTLLEAATPEEVEAEPAGYHLVVEEMLRGVRLTTGLTASATEPGWITVRCFDEHMADWLLRTVVAENVFARSRNRELYLPSGPSFRLAKEVKNVVVALAKTNHYWSDHLSPAQREAAARVMSGEGAPPLLQPATRTNLLARADEYRATTKAMRQAIELPTVPRAALGWVGVRLPDELTAAWYVRAAIAENVLARREEEVMYLPVPAAGSRLEAVERLARLHRLREDQSEKR